MVCVSRLVGAGPVGNRNHAALMVGAQTAGRAGSDGGAFVPEDGVIHPYAMDIAAQPFANGKQL